MFVCNFIFYIFYYSVPFTTSKGVFSLRFFHTIPIDKRMVNPIVTPKIPQVKSPGLQLIVPTILYFCCSHITIFVTHTANMLFTSISTPVSIGSLTAKFQKKSCRAYKLCIFLSTFLF